MHDDTRGYDQVYEITGKGNRFSGCGQTEVLCLVWEILDQKRLFQLSKEKQCCLKLLQILMHIQFV